MALRSKIGARASTTLPRLAGGAGRGHPRAQRRAVGDAVRERAWPAAVAADLCRDGPCRAIDLQIVARAIADLRLGSLRRYRRSGGAAVLPAVWFDRVAAESGGATARRALIAAATRGERLAGRSGGARAQRARPRAPRRSRRCARAACWPRRRAAGRRSSPSPIRRSPTWCSPRRWPTARAPTGPGARCCAGAPPASGCASASSTPSAATCAARSTAEERRAVFRSVGGVALRLGLALALVALVVAALFADSRRAYTLALDPPDARRRRAHRGAARPAAALAPELHPQPSAARLDPGRHRLHGGRALARHGRPHRRRRRDRHARRRRRRDRAAASHVPGWLREVLNGLRPVPRGIAKALLGDPDGVAALKQAFADPVARGEILSTLAVIGRGGAGEDEILADALADHAPEIRRRGVEVAAAIDRRQAGEKIDGRQAGEKPATGGRAAGTARTRAHPARGAGRSLGRRARGGPAGGADAAGRRGGRDPDARAARSRSDAAAAGRGGDRARWPSARPARGRRAGRRAAEPGRGGAPRGADAVRVDRRQGAGARARRRWRGS